MRRFFPRRDSRQKSDPRVAITNDYHVDDSSTNVASNDGHVPPGKLSLHSHDALAIDRHRQTLSSNLSDDMNPADSSQLDHFSRGSKRQKDQDEMSGVSYKKEAKKRRSPAQRSSARTSPVQNFQHFRDPVTSDNRSDTRSPPPRIPPSATDDATLDMSTGSAFSLVDYEEEEKANQAPITLLKDLQTRAITVPQLIQEVKGIYAGLAMVEKKCVEIVDVQMKSSNKLAKEQWQALIALHRTLLNEHHDFFSASHHPVTHGHELRELALRHSMPARMWRHGIHGFLELLRHKLPDSLEHMISFLYLSYSMVALLKETVPEFLETWVECLGDLARYRMAIEETDPRDREIWAATARTHYNQAADLSPNTGRIQHHLAVLARPHIVQQLFLYTKALVAAIPFRNAADSILLLLNPLVDPKSRALVRHAPADLNFVCAAASLFKRRNLNEFLIFRSQFASSFQSHLGNSGSKFKVLGVEYAGSLFALVMDCGNRDNTLWRMIFNHQEDMKRRYIEQTEVDPERLARDFVVRDADIIDPPRREYWSQSDIPAEWMSSPSPETDRMDYTSDDVSSYISPMLFQAIADVAGHIGNKNTVPFMHMVLAYLYGLTWVPGASIYLERSIPWDSVAKFLNTVGRSGVSYETIESPEFPRSYGGSKRQLPEDFVMRGLMVTTYYYKADFFSKENLLDEDERLLEVPSHQTPRVERCLWAGHKLATLTDRWLSYDGHTKMFATTTHAQTLVD